MHMEPQDSSTSNVPLAHVDPYLPPELERLIFELAARDMSPKGSTTLLLVAKRVHNWIRPLIFRVFNQMAKPPFPDLKNSPRLLETTGHLAERLLVGYNPTQHYLETLLSFCPNLVDLATWVFRIKSIFPILDKLPLQRLSANFDDLTYEDFLARPFFVNLTHLEIFTFIGKTWDKKFEALVHLPNLTHLSIGFPVDDDVIPQLLRYCRLLRILIIAPPSPSQYLERRGTKKLLAEINDHRLVLLQIPPFPALIQDWVKGAHGGIDCWAFSELVSLAQSRNYFVAPPPWYFPRIGFDWEGCLNENGSKWFAGLHLHDPWSPTS